MSKHTPGANTGDGSMEKKGGKAAYLSGSTTSKVERYRWGALDGMGSFKLVRKETLQVDHRYQREDTEAKVLKFAAEFSWKLFGVLLVSRRADSTMWVFDGQHRHAATLRRSDITHVPCLIFAEGKVEGEARSFLGVNSTRASVANLDKYRALLTAKDPDAVFVHELAIREGITFVKGGSRSPLSCRSVGWFLKWSKIEKERVQRIATVTANLCRAEQMPIGEVLLDGLRYLDAHGVSLDDARVRSRLNAVGFSALMRAAANAAAYYAKGGAKIYAQGMIEALNKHQRRRFKLIMPDELEEVTDRTAARSNGSSMQVQSPGAQGRDP